VVFPARVAARQGDPGRSGLLPAIRGYKIRDPIPRVVVINRLVQLLLGDIEKAGLHDVWYFAKTSWSSTAWISPRR